MTVSFTIRTERGLAAARQKKPTMSNFYWKRLAPLTATLGAVVVHGLLGTGTGAASAGTNGQHIDYYSYYADAQCTTGKNEKGQKVKVCTSLHTGSNLSQDFLWVGSVTIIWHRYNDDTITSSTCAVPTSQDSDSVRCSEPS